MIESSSALADLVGLAQTGDSPSMERLAGLVRERLYPYARRVLLDHEAAEDVVQDVSVTILQSLGSLRQASRFWPWAFSIATNKIRERFRREARHRALSICDVGDSYMRALADNPHSTLDGLDQAARQELAERVQGAMRELGERYRMVLSLRFYENMAHREIAEVIGCSELNARVTFFQAKRALMGKLRALGISKAAFATALAAFGHLTLAPQASAASAAAVMVSAAALREGLVGTLLTAKVKAAGMVAAACIAGVALLNPSPTTAPQSSGSPATGVHFTHQSMIGNSAPLDFENTRSQGAYEHWYSFPDGVDGPFLFRMQRWDPRQENKLCWWVQDGNANYYVNTGDGNVYISNARLVHASFATRILPTDSEGFCAFIQEIEGNTSNAMINQPGLEYERDPNTGYAARRVDRRFAWLGPQESVYEYGKLSPDLFQPPADRPIKDERDAMHKRGWTVFDVAGRLDGKGVAGSGRIAFTYDAGKTHPAWIELRLDGSRVAMDDGKKARLVSGGTTELYPGGSLFRGLSRPWIGFHTLDSIRRDAARERIWYSTRIIDPDRTAEVQIRANRPEGRYTATYRVDLERDVLESVQLWRTPAEQPERYLGMLTFSYHQEIAPDVAPADPPNWSAGTGRENRGEPSILWMFRLTDGHE